MNKKGELTSTQIIALVLALAGFAIVLILLFSLDIGTYSEDEVCKLSVLSRATSPNALNQLVPLKCKTKKVCITDKLFGGECNDFSGEENVDFTRLGVLSSSEEKAEKIEQVVANEMYSCWNMMGQGKLDLFNGVDNPNSIGEQFASFLEINGMASSCVVCSRISVDDDLGEESFREIAGLVDVNDYLQKKEAPNSNGLSYIEALTDRRARSYTAEVKESVFLNNASNKKTDQLAVVFMQILTEESPEDIFVDKSIKAGSFVFVTGASMGHPIKGAIFGAGAGILGGSISAAGQSYKRSVSAGYCQEVTGHDNAKSGCSIVTTVDYDNIEEFNKLCGRIEGEV